MSKGTEPRPVLWKFDSCTQSTFYLTLCSGGSDRCWGPELQWQQYGWPGHRQDERDCAGGPYRAAWLDVGGVCVCVCVCAHMCFRGRGAGRSCQWWHQALRVWIGFLIEKGKWIQKLAWAVGWWICVPVEFEIKVDKKHVLFYYSTLFFFPTRIYSWKQEIIGRLEFSSSFCCSSSSLNISLELRMVLGFLKLTPAKIPHKFTSPGTCVLVRVLTAARSVPFSLLK